MIIPVRCFTCGKVRLSQKNLETKINSTEISLRGSRDQFTTLQMLCLFRTIALVFIITVWSYSPLESVLEEAIIVVPVQ